MFIQILCKWIIKNIKVAPDLQEDFVASLLNLPKPSVRPRVHFRHPSGGKCWHRQLWTSTCSDHSQCLPPLLLGRIFIANRGGQGAEGFTRGQSATLKLILQQGVGGFRGPYSSQYHVPGSGSSVAYSSTYLSIHRPVPCPVRLRSMPQNLPSQTAGKEDSQRSLICSISPSSPDSSWSLRRKEHSALSSSSLGWTSTWLSLTSRWSLSSQLLWA